MDDWLLWLIAAVVLGVGEILTLGFFLAPFAGGALVAVLVSAIGGGDVFQWASFLVVSAVLLGALRPLARSHRRMPPQIRTGTAALVGKSAVVLEQVHGQGGSVRLEGEVWSARPFEEDVVIEAGARVHVIEIRGATALVSE